MPLDDRPATEALALLAAQLQRLRFGSLRVVIHDGRIAEVEITEKRRFT